MERVIFHVDVNSAFLSWEATRRVGMGLPDLRLVPSAVGGDATSRRSIICAKSIPAKAFGIVTGEPVSLALRKCPTLEMVKPDFKLYHKCSAAFIEICRNYSPLVEQFSIDECFLDMTGMELIFPDIVKTANDLKNEIRDKLGFTVNVGVGANKLLAKMASDFQKPDKVHTLFKSEIEKKMWPLPVADLFMAGKSTTSRLSQFGIRTIGDLAKSDIESIISIVGDKMGDTLIRFANGIDDSPVSEAFEDAKSYSMSMTLEEDIVDYSGADDVLRIIAEQVSRKMRADKAQCQCIGVTIRSEDFKNKSHQRKLVDPTDISIEIFNIAVELFREIWDKKTPLRLLNISLSDIVRDEPIQMSLFMDEHREKRRKMDKVMDSVCDRYGKNTMVRGSLYKRNK